MKHSQAEIIAALNVIKETCEEFSPKCNGCPLRSKKEICGFYYDIPRKWDVKNENEPWRAFNV